MLRHVAAAMILMVVAAVPVRVQVQHPSSLTVGSDVVERTGQAERRHLLGAQDLYSVALYRPPSAGQAQLASADVPKAIRIVVTFKEDLQRPFIPDWRGELIPRIDADATSLLRSTFAPLRQGDVILVEYVPGKGTSLRVNKLVAVSDAHHDLMLAYLDHWIGQRPVSEDLKRALAGRS